jgi:hypothetical protein
LINSETMIAEIQQAVAEEVRLRPKEIDIEHQGKICKPSCKISQMGIDSTGWITASYDTWRAEKVGSTC